MARAAPVKAAVERHGTKSRLFWQIANRNRSKRKSRPEDKTPQELHRKRHLYQVGYEKLQVRDLSFKSAVFCRICL